MKVSVQFGPVMTKIVCILFFMGINISALIYALLWSFAGCGTFYASSNVDTDDEESCCISVAEVLVIVTSCDKVSSTSSEACDECDDDDVDDDDDDDDDLPKGLVVWVDSDTIEEHGKFDKDEENNAERIWWKWR